MKKIIALVLSSVLFAFVAAAARAFTPQPFRPGAFIAPLPPLNPHSVFENPLAPNLAFEHSILVGTRHRLYLSHLSELALQERFTRSSSNSIPTFDFVIAGMNGSLRFRSEAMRIPIDRDRGVYYKSSKLLYKYEPKYWPTGIIDFMSKAFVRPAASFLEKSFTY